MSYNVGKKKERLHRIARFIPASTTYYKRVLGIASGYEVEPQIWAASILGLDLTMIEENGGDRVSKIRPGDRVWVKTPRVLTERKVGTIVATKKRGGDVRYLVEWEVDLVEQPNGHHPGYRASEIVSIHRKNP